MRVYKSRAVLTTEGFVVSGDEEQRASGRRPVRVESHVAALALGTAVEALALQELLVRVAGKRWEGTPSGHAVREEFVRASVVAEAAAVTLGGSWTSKFSKSIYCP
jgi:hypothetical protein